MPRQPKRPRDPPGPEGPSVRVPPAANRGGGRGPRAPPDPVAGSDPRPERPRRRQRRQENLPGWVRPDSPEDVDGEDVGQSSRGRLESEEEEEDEPKRKVRKDALPEGDYLVKWSSIEDKVRYIRWGAISTEHLRETIASIADWMIRESGLDRALCRPMHKPHLAACMEFVHSFEKSRDKLSGTGTVRGEVIRIDAELIEQVFGIPHGMDPLSSVIHHVHVKDWMPIRDEVAKRYVAHACAYVGWAPVLQAVSMVLMAGRRPRCVSAHLLMYLQARFGTGGQKRTTKYNIASFIASSISRETAWVKNHLKVRDPQRYCETFVGIPLTQIFLHRGVITEEECETAFDIPETGWDFPADGPEVAADEERDIPTADGGISDGGDAGAYIPESRAADPAPQAVDDGILATLRAEVQRITQEKDEMATELARLQSHSRWQRQSLLDPGETRVKTLVLDIFDLLVHVITKKSDRQMAETMGYVVYRMEVGERPPSYIVRGNIREVLGTCMEMAHCVIWTSKSRAFTMSVIMDLDRRCLLPTGVASELDEFVMDRLLPWLRRWAHDTSPTTSWVELYRREVDGADPFAGLRRYWGQASDIDRRIIWRNVPQSEAMMLAGFWRAMLVQTRYTDCPGDDCPPAPEAEDPTPEAENPTLEPEEPTRELDEPTREPVVLAEESARVPLGVPCSRRLPLFGMESAWHSWSAM
ncbi:hypothetical protein R1sor_012585 [Riccia sorocarpa]|uniref:FCP1 homology domain-containing protein n=1 Tax=Riccia sorocarpa TaxID=122646 RepID=A0ABD3IAE2_9MARC